MTILLCLGVESTAHTFSCAVLEGSKSGRMRILSDVRAVYRPPGGEGIHPREASRHHVENAPRVLAECLAGAGVSSAASLDAVAYAAGPGLGPCLRVGAVVARSISAYYSVPIHPVNHAVGHIDLGMMLTGAADPLVLLVSGGHTMLLAFVGRRWRVFGETLDITLGQMFDQFGRSLGYPSPCGRQIESLAGGRGGDGGKGAPAYVPLPYTVKGNDVSLSGLLSAAKRAAGEHGAEAASYSLQETAFAMVCEAVERALSFTGRKELLVVGGVAANARLSGMLRSACRRQGCRLYAAPLKYAGDCGSQIACTGLHVAGAAAPAAAVGRSGRAGRRRVSRRPAAPGRAGVALRDAFVRQSWRLDGVDVDYRGAGGRSRSKRS